jgi:hypothetical protein
LIEGPFERVRCRSAELGGSIPEIEIGAKKWTGGFDFFGIFSEKVPQELLAGQVPLP